MTDKDQVLERLRIIGANINELNVANLTVAQLEAVAYGVERTKLSFSHLANPVGAHLQMQDMYKMRACPFCRAHLFPMLEA